MLSSAAPYVAVMDADLQHDETLLPGMLARLKAEELDLVIGSRYAAGGSTGEWSRRRLFLSRLGIRALPFAAAQACAVWLAMTSNYLLNNAITYRDQRLRGLRFWRGLAAFYVICSIGAVANVGVGTLLYARGGIWWLAGLASAIVGAAWNYAASRFFTWRGGRR
jgi:dolichol-phosphate mannosyltransferase